MAELGKSGFGYCILKSTIVPRASNRRAFFVCSSIGSKAQERCRCTALAAMNVKKRWERPKKQGNAVDFFQGRLNFSLMDYVRFVVNKARQLAYVARFTVLVVRIKKLFFTKGSANVARLLISASVRSNFFLRIEGKIFSGGFCEGTEGGLGFVLYAPVTWTGLCEMTKHG
jgi:hypothetical protein